MGLGDDGEIEAFALDAQAAFDAAVGIAFFGGGDDALSGFAQIESNFNGFVGARFDVLALLIAAIVPGDDFVIAGRDAGDFKFAVGVGAGEEAIGGYVD